MCNQKEEGARNEPRPNLTKKGSRDCWNSRASGQNTITDTFLSMPSLWTFLHSLINNQHSIQHTQIGNPKCYEPITHISYLQDKPGKAQAAWFEDTYESSDIDRGLALHMHIIVCLAKLMAQRNTLPTNQVFTKDEALHIHSHIYSENTSLFHYCLFLEKIWPKTTVLRKYALTPFSVFLISQSLSKECASSPQPPNFFSSSKSVTPYRFRSFFT